MQFLGTKQSTYCGDHPDQRHANRIASVCSGLDTIYNDCLVSISGSNEEDLQYWMAVNMRMIPTLLKIMFYLKNLLVYRCDVDVQFVYLSIIICSKED